MVVSTAQQQPPTVTSVLNMLYGVVEQEVVSAAEAMPEDQYSSAPTNGEFKGVKTFAEQVKHIAFANHLYFGPLMGETINANSIEENPNGPATLKTKAEIVQYLKDSFALGHRVISGITSENEVTPLPKPVSPFLSTRLAIAIIGAFHPKDHYGQMVEYLRMNGIVPPASLIGVRDGDLEPVGMTDADFVSFDTTKINEFLHRYTDPQSSCEVQKLTLSGLRFVVISVLEFKDIPIICKRAANSSNDSSKTILKLGGLYVRTEKATSVLIPTSEEMRDLLNRAMLKRGDQLLGQIRTLLTGNPPAKEEDIKQYDGEIAEARKYFKESLPKEFEKYGYWEVISMPLTYSRERVPTITEVYKSLVESEVHYRGWNFPHFDKNTKTNFANGRQSHTSFMHHVEAHRAYQSGLFVWRGLYWENFPQFEKEHGKALSFVNVIYTVTEFLLFLKRYYERISPDASIRFSIAMTDIEDRSLEATDWNSMPLMEDYSAKVPTLKIEREYTVSELRTTAEEIAIGVVQKIFEVFNWNSPDPNMIRGWQQRFLSRTF